jgi:ABC-2 type transport system permease protein
VTSMAINTEVTAGQRHRSNWQRAIVIGGHRILLELKALSRNRMAAMFTFVLPLILLIIFGAVLKGDIAPGVTFTEYFAAGMIASGAFYSAFQNLAVSVSIERDSLALKRLSGTPMPAASYFIGKIGMVIVTYTIQVGILIGLGSVLCGLQLPATAGRWFTFTWVSMLGLTACSLLGLAISGLIRRSEGAGAIVSPVVVVLQFMSGVYFQYDSLPGWMRDVSSVFPLRWLALGMRSVFLPANFASREPGGGWQHGITALVLGAWVIFGFAVASRRFQWFREES